MISNWNTDGVEAGDMVRLDAGEFESRLGHGWARGRLKHGDLLIATAHGGDRFFYYQLVEASKVTLDGVETLRLEPVGKPIGAYTLGRIVGRIDSAALSALERCEDVTVEVPESFDTPTRTGEEEITVTSFGDVFRSLRSLPPGMLASELWLRDDSGRSALGATLVANHDTGKTRLVANE